MWSMLLPMILANAASKSFHNPRSCFDAQAIDVSSVFVIDDADERLVVLTEPQVRVGHVNVTWKPWILNS